MRMVTCWLTTPSKKFVTVPMEFEMKVLNKPDVSNWSYKHRCDNCECELEVEAKDLRYYRYEGDMRESGYETYSAACAVCNDDFTIPNEKVPRLIQLEAQDRTKRVTTSQWDR
jgi:hypothetical protein